MFPCTVAMCICIVTITINWMLYHFNTLSFSLQYAVVNSFPHNSRGKNSSGESFVWLNTSPLHAQPPFPSISSSFFFTHPQAEFFPVTVEFIHLSLEQHGICGQHILGHVCFHGGQLLQSSNPQLQRVLVLLHNTAAGLKSNPLCCCTLSPFSLSLALSHSVTLSLACGIKAC